MGFDVAAGTGQALDMTSLPPVDKVIAHTNTYWTWQGGPGRVADVVGTADVTFAAAGAKA